jgi:hypothetical protein
MFIGFMDILEDPNLAASLADLTVSIIASLSRIKGGFKRR